MPALHLSLLGPFNATLDNQPLYNFKTNKVQALLVYLAVEGERALRREKLMELLWPEMPLESAQVNLRQTIYRLRQAIPEVTSKDGNNQVPLIISDRQSVGLNPDADIHVDVDEFHLLLGQNPAQAADLYRGAFLADFYLVDSSQFEAWAERIRENLRRKILDCLDNLTRKSLDARDYSQAQSYAWRQLEIDNLRESAYRQLMSALANNGQRNAALAQYQICQRRLAQELNLKPSQETETLYEKIQVDALRHTKVPLSKGKPTTAGDMPIFVLTDIERSTQLWDTHHQAMLPALLKHNTILQDRIAEHGGRILELRGDGVKAVFEGVNPLNCMIDIQKELGSTDWDEIGDLRIRIGLHGMSSVRKGYDYFKKDDQYYGPVLNHASRIMDAGWGGQILVSEQVRNTCTLPVGGFWQDFGTHKLKSLEQPVKIFGLLHPDLPIQTFPPLRTLNNQEKVAQVEGPRVQHNLPSQPTPFIGRTQELTILKGLLSNRETRLVTIVGPGGMGKTRLAIAAAERYITDQTLDWIEHPYPDGLFFVPLAPIYSADNIIPEIAEALEVPVETSQTTERTSEAEVTQGEKLLNYLENKRMLIILDNFEHLLDGVEIITRILSTAPNIQLLITSRERLHLREEQIFPIQGLEFPDWEAPEDPGDYAAMELFLQSAQRILPVFKIESSDMVYLTRICNLVGGMPLGLEMAASWVDILSIQDIATEIGKSLDFLETDVRNVPDRHRSIRAVFDSSWQHLSSIERKIFPRFSVFRGGFTRDAAQHVAGASIRNMATFVNKSLVQYNQLTDSYQIHELLRQYGRDLLEANIEDKVSTQDRHSVYYCNLLKHEIDSLVIGDHMAMDRIGAGLSNFQEAWRWAVNQGNVDSIDNAVNGLCMNYDWNWRGKDGVLLCEQALDMLHSKMDAVQSSIERGEEVNNLNRVFVKVLSWCGYFNLYFEHDKAFRLLQQSRKMVDALVQKTGIGYHEKIQVLFFQGLVYFLSGDFIAAKNLFQESLNLSLELNHLYWVLRNYFTLGDTARESGTPREAKFWYEKSLVEARRNKNKWTEIMAIRALGWAARKLMAYDEAANLFDECLSLSEAYNNPMEKILALEALGFLDLFLGNFNQAIERFTQAISISKKLWIQHRTISSQIHIGVSSWLAGNLEEADSPIKAAISMVQKDRPFSKIFSTVFYAEYLTIIGRYHDAHNQLLIAQSLSDKVYLDRFMEGRFTRTLGWIALAEKDYVDAAAQFEKSISLYQIITDDEQIAWSQAGLARAMMGQGRPGEARQLLTEALWTSIEIQGIIPLLFTLPMVILYLSNEGSEKTAEFYKQIQVSPFLAKAKFFKDIVYGYLPGEVLSSPMVVSTQPSDVTKELWSTAAGMLSNWIQMWMDEPVPTIKDRPV